MFSPSPVPRGRLAPSRTLGFAALCLGHSLAGQSAFPGFMTTPRYTATGVQHEVAALGASRNGDTVWLAHRGWLYAIDRQGTPTLEHSLPGNDWVGAIVVDANTDDVLFTNWSAHTLLVRDGATGQTRTLGSTPGNSFDLALVPGTTTLLTTANPAWPTPGARPGVWHIDPLGGRHREIVQLAGVSGPLAFTSNGDLVCVTVSATFPPPAGSSRVLRFGAARLAQALAGGIALTIQDAAVVGPPLDGAYGLAIDHRDRAYISDANLGQVWQVDLNRGASATTHFLTSGSAGTTQIAWVAGPGPATFDGFQPGGGGALFVTIADWARVRTDVVQIEAARPTLEARPSNPVPRGAASLRVEGAAASAPCALFLSELPAVSAYAAFAWQGAPMFFGLDPRMAPLVWPTVADTNGTVTWNFVHAGGGGVSFTAQALSLAPSAGGTTAALPVDLAR